MGALMKAFELLGVLSAFAVIIVIDTPKLKATANKKNIWPSIIRL
jgi:hypothetical protein